MDRVHNLPQFLQWLKQRASKRDQQESLSTQPHSPKCHCRHCMKLPQLPREQRRLQRAMAAHRYSDSPEHIYEEITPEMVRTLSKGEHSREDSNVVGVVPDVNLVLRQNENSEVDLDTSGSKGHNHQLPDSQIVSDSQKCNISPQNGPTDYRESVTNDRSSTSKEVQITKQKSDETDSKDKSVNLGNLDFAQAKEFGGFLVVPMRDRMVFQLIDKASHKNAEHSKQNLEQCENKLEFCDTKLEPCDTNTKQVQDDELCLSKGDQDRMDSVSSRDQESKATEVNTAVDVIKVNKTDHLETFKAALSNHIQSHKQDKSDVQDKTVPISGETHLTHSETDLSSEYLLEQTVLSIPEQTAVVCHTTSSAFTRYLPNSSKSSSCQQSHSSHNSVRKSKSAFRIVQGYDPRRSSFSTDTSGDSGAYFPNDHDVSMTSSRSSNQNCQNNIQSNISDRSNDTYSEYDIRSDDSGANSSEYDQYLKKVQQVRSFEENIQQILRESESETDCSSSPNHFSDSQSVETLKTRQSPLSVLDAGDILTLVSSEGNAQLLNDILFNNESVSHDDLINAIKSSTASSKPGYKRHNLDKLTGKKKQVKAASCDIKRFSRSSENLERLSCRATNYTPPHTAMKLQPKTQKRDVPSKENSIPSARNMDNSVSVPHVRGMSRMGGSNRLLGDLMRQNHDRQLFL